LGVPVVGDNRDSSAITLSQEDLACARRRRR